jgi:hypothetical protein
VSKQIIELKNILIDKADEYLKQHKYSEAAKLFEAEAKSTNNAPEKIVLYKKASRAYHEYGSYDDEARCLMSACSLLDGDEKLDCLVSCWKTYITAIAVFQYDTGFEWKGEAENLHESYDETIQGYYSKAVNMLKTALKIRNVDKVRLLNVLKAECVKRHSEGGWAASECISSIDEAFKSE